MLSDADQQPRIVTADRVDTAVVAGQGVPVAKLPAFFDRAFPALAAARAAQGVAPAGPAFALYRAPQGPPRTWRWPSQPRSRCGPTARCARARCPAGG